MNEIRKKRPVELEFSAAFFAKWLAAHCWSLHAASASASAAAQLTPSQLGVANVHFSQRCNVLTNLLSTQPV